MITNVACSWMMGDSTLIKRLTADICADPATEPKAVEAMGLLVSGQPIPKDMCPSKIWGDGSRGPIDRLPNLFNANGYYVVSAEAAEIIGQFDLGQGALYPVEIYQSDQVTPVVGPWYCWVFGNSKTGLNSKASRGLKPFGVSGLRFNMPQPLPDDAVAVQSRAVDGPHVWTDPTLFKSVFVSGDLAAALTNAGMAKDFRLANCVIAE